MKTRGERSRRAESGDRRSVSQPKSQDSGIVLEESSDQLETDYLRAKVTDEQVKFKLAFGIKMGFRMSSPIREESKN